MRANAFGSFHPAVIFSFFACAIALGMFVRHPAFHAVALAASAACYLNMRGLGGVRFVAAMAVMFVVLSLANPLFNPMGDTVLFTYAGGRSFTWEALAFGASTAAMFVSTMLWFACFNMVMTTDKLVFLFGRVAPALSLVLSMILRLVPHYQRKAHQLVTARACMGARVDEGGMLDRVRDGGSVLSALTTWAFEHGIVTADSMRSRGYGVARRTSFASYRLEARDIVLGAAVFLLTCLVVACIALGAAGAEYLPSIVLPGATPLFAVGVVSYAVLLFLPAIIDVKEAVSWRISLSSI